MAMTSPNLTEAEILGTLTDQARQSHDAQLLQFRSLVGAHQYLRLYQLCTQYISPGARVLDWGCGNGHFAYYLINRGYEAWGFSFADFPLRPALVSQGFQFQQGSPDEPVCLPYADQQFDAVVSVGVLEHVREHQGSELASLREIHRILKPQGVFICYHFPNRYSLIELAASRLPNKYSHAYRYTQSDIRMLCQQTQFNLLTVKRYGLLPRNVLGNLANGLSQSRGLARGWDVCDHILSEVFSGICQNYYFVARK